MLSVHLRSSINPASMTLSSAWSKETGMGPKTKKPRQMPRPINSEQKTRLSGRVSRASRCVHSNSRCYENRSIPCGKVFLTQSKDGKFADMNTIESRISIIFLLNNLKPQVVRTKAWTTYNDKPYR